MHGEDIFKQGTGSKVKPQMVSSQPNDVSKPQTRFQENQKLQNKGKSSDNKTQNEAIEELNEQDDVMN